MIGILDRAYIPYAYIEAKKGTCIRKSAISNLYNERDHGISAFRVVFSKFLLVVPVLLGSPDRHLRNGDESKNGGCRVPDD